MGMPEEIIVRKVEPDTGAADFKPLVVEETPFAAALAHAAANEAHALVTVGTYRLVSENRVALMATEVG